MTRNNLGQHLSWLLNRGLTDFSPLDTLTRSDPNIVFQNSSVPVVEQQNRQLHEDPLGGIQNTELRNEQPQLRHSDGDALVEESNMARLHLLPSSESKPRMLSCGKRTSPVTPTTPTARRSRESESSKIQDQRQQSAAQGSTSLFSTHSKRKSPSRQKGPILSSDFNSIFDDIESIDLTGDAEHSTSSGTVEAFGEPQRLWREDFAARVEPLSTRGKKRKSDEYQSDLVSPRKNSPRVKASGIPSKNRILDRDSSPRSQRASSSPAKNSTRELASRSPVPPAVSTLDKYEGSPAHKKVDDCDLFRSESDDDFQYPLLPDEDKGSPSPSKKPEPKQTVTPTPPIEPSTRNVLSRSSSPRKAQAIAEPVASTPLSQKCKDPKVEAFLELHPTVVDSAIKKLNQDVVANAAIVVQHAMEGELPPPELLAQNKSARSKIDALEKIKLERATHDKKKTRKNDLKNIMVTAVADGGDLSGVMAEVKESQAIMKELQQIESEMSDLLALIDLDLSAFPAATTSSNLEASTSDEARNMLPGSRVQEIRRELQHEVSTISRSFSPQTSVSSVAASFGLNEARSTYQDGDTTMDDNIDDFDFDAEDDDFLEAANNLTDFGTNIMEDHFSTGRKVFAETSGNAARIPTPKKHTVTDPSGMMSFPWSKDVKTVMKDRFHLKGFRPNQLEAINATLSGKDAFVLMPTGGGKSLCYQLPSVINSGRTRGITIVVSPLLSLMEDQVEHLRKLKIKAHYINGEVSVDQRKWISSTLRKPYAEQEIELLYITPEMINKSMSLRDTFKVLHRNGKFARLVIDEAHCVSQWGHDFRPDYKELGSFRTEFPGVPVMALTATATQSVKVDVIQNLGMSGCDVLTQSFNRPNLTYDVLPKKGAMEDIVSQMADIIKASYKGKAGIVYCLSRKDCEKVAQQLREHHRIKATHYHAGMKAEDRSSVQRDWQSGKYDVIVATIAFGMGIDKPDVRFVIHHTIPKSLEGYYQETGRAGRDGKRSGCYLFYSYKDTTQQRRFIEQGDGNWQQKDRQRQMLRNVIQFCENESDCRRVQILAYFNESFRAEDCHRTCDNCKSDATFETRDFTAYARKAVELVGEFTKNDEDVTLLHCIDIFAGSSKKMRGGHSKLPQYGAGSQLDLGVVERLFYRLVSEEALQEISKFKSKFIHQYVRLGRKADQVLQGRQIIKMHVLSNRSDTTSTAPRRTAYAGATGAMEYQPQSTNVPSPIQTSRKRAVRKAKTKNTLSDDDDSDGFEPIRIAGKSSRRKKAELGPPITQDDRLASLDDIHRMVVEDFLTNAKDLCQKIMMEKHLRSQPFSDTVLREMALTLPQDITQMLSIDDIETDKVQRYGTQFLKLTQNSRIFLADMQGNKEMNNEVVHDPNHTNVISISSDEDEYSSAEDVFATLSQMDPDAESITSRYFNTESTNRPSRGSRSTRPSCTQLTDLDGVPVTGRGASSVAKSAAARSRTRTTGKRASSSGVSGGRKKTAGTSKRNYSGGSQRAKSRTTKSGGSSSGTGRTASGSGSGPSSRRGATGTSSKSSSLARIEMMPT